jgi:hypothetical protein
MFSTGDRWQRLWPQLLDAETPSDVFALLESAGVGDLREFTTPVLEMIPRVIRERTFPKERVERQIAFLSDSLAALGELSPRHSRDSCTEIGCSPFSSTRHGTSTAQPSGSDVMRPVLRTLP